MQITVESRAGFTILRLGGDFDAVACPELERQIDDLIAGGTNRVTLNLGSVKFFDSTALGTVIKASKALDRAGGKLAISKPSRFCRGVLKELKLDRMMAIRDTDEEAGAAILE